MSGLAWAFGRLGAALRARGGASAVEFAILLPVIAAIIVPLVDLGMGLYTQEQVQVSAQAGAQYAALKGWNSGANASAIQTAVTSATSLSSVRASPAPSQSCGCLNGASIVAASCASTCPDGSTPGIYVTVNAQAAYTPLLPYPILGNAVTLTSQSTVRVPQ